MKSEDKRIRRVGPVLENVVQTTWGPDAESSVSLQDFGITVPESDRNIEVCVRDHECEDGDEIRVSVNSKTIFNGEIDNDWVRDKMEVNSGRNRIELYAINGTGYKGASCSHADANTGEIRVKGSNSQTQSWRHRGGAGSSADIIVEVE